MDPERWRQIEDLYHAALEQDSARLLSFLDQACQGDEELLREVRSLLGQDNVVSPIDRPVLHAQRLDERLGAGATVGSYRILRLVGEGGMGAVYEAEQQQPRRVVALKVIKPGLATSQLLRRFEQEAQSLGRLQHPGIAQIHEAGAADTGFGPQPYFAMEFIHGQGLQDYVRAHRLDTRQRLAIMAKICDAVHHAHQRGLIHRDLKPGNILVDDTGQPKIVDFGVARVTDSDARATRHTDLGQLVGTLAYMSPEQTLGDPLEVDTRSDVYAMGMILYELLAGAPPYQISRNLPEAVRTIREQDPLALSSINKMYRGDIETIVAKALEKDKARRYESAAALAADIRRHLQDEPITARPPSASYQLKKFARRHKAFVVGVIAVCVVLLAGVAASTWQAVRATAAEQTANRERDRAAAEQQKATEERDRAVKADAQAREERNLAVTEKQRADAESAIAKAVNEFLQKDLLAQASANAQAGPNTPPDPDLKVRTALDRASDRIGGKFETLPLVEASIRQTIGDTYLKLGLYPDAQREIERAVDLRRRVAGEEAPDTMNSMNSLAESYLRQGKLEQAESLYSKIVAGERRVLGDEHRDTLASMADLAVLYRQQGKYAQAEALLIKTLKLQQRSLGEEHSDTLSMMNNLAVLYGRQGKNAQAEPLYERILDIRRRRQGEQHPLTLGVMNNLGVAYMSQGKYAQAEPLLEKVLEVRRRVVGEEHPDTLASGISLAFLYKNQGKYAQAEPLLVQVIEVQRRVLGEEHPDTLTAMGNLAVVYRLERKYAEAEPLVVRALAGSRRVLGEEHPDTLVTMSNLAELYGDQGRSDEAEVLYARALEVRRRVLGAQHPSTLSVMSNLGVAYFNQGKFAQAELSFRTALNAYEKTKSDSWQRYNCQSLLGATLEREGKYSEAEPLLLSGYRGMVERRATMPAQNQILVDNAAESISRLYQDWGKAEKAAAWRETIAK